MGNVGDNVGDDMGDIENYELDGPRNMWAPTFYGRQCGRHRELRMGAAVRNVGAHILWATTDERCGRCGR